MSFSCLFTQGSWYPGRSDLRVYFVATPLSIVACSVSQSEFFLVLIFHRHFLGMERGIGCILSCFAVLCAAHAFWCAPGLDTPDGCTLVGSPERRRRQNGFHSDDNTKHTRSSEPLPLLVAANVTLQGSSPLTSVAVAASNIPKELSHNKRTASRGAQRRKTVFGFVSCLPIINRSSTPAS